MVARLTLDVRGGQQRSYLAEVKVENFPGQ